MTGEIAIVGAGPAGLTAALAGRQAGLAVRVYEQAPDARPAGGGLMLHSNGLRVLDALGVLDALRPDLRFTSVTRLEPLGRRPVRTDLGELTIPHNHLAVVLRADLQEALRAAVERAGVPVEFGRRLASVAKTPAGARLTFEDGGSAEAAAVVGADGLHSRVRTALGLPAEVVPVGEAYLRGVADRPTAADDVRELWGPDGRRFGICPLPHGRTYFFCSAPLGRWAEVRASGLAGWVEGWRPFGADVVALLEAVPAWDRVNYAELSEVRMPRFAFPPAYLIGDAAHAMTPNLGQGGNSSMVDAVVLMRLLAADPATAGAKYDALRRPFVTATQAAARRVGRMAALRSRPLRWARDMLMRLASAVPAVRRGLLRTAAGYNPAEEDMLTRQPGPANGAA
ncbi:MAG TPA: NAD(P)/FAD-dependent oxidoreductase [Gemmataceae bacterium]|nr:NAD(P)/FAD-dependent oxidoreductase [Gemmataceae bacterium]